MKEKAYRLGHVVKEEMTVYACCRLIPKENTIFEYVEVEYEDGSHRFFYEDEKGYEHFESNFVSKRFTSYHEFFTTGELAVEMRGSLGLKYFVRHGTECYEKTDLSALIALLDEKAANGAVERIPDRITVYGKYDKKCTIGDRC